MRYFRFIGFIFITAFCSASTLYASNSYNFVDLGTLGGSYSFAYDLNNAGQIVGTSITSGDRRVRAVLWQGGEIYDLGGGRNRSPYGATAYGINELGQIVGENHFGTASTPLYWESKDHAFEQLISNGGFTSAADINESSDIVGSSRPTNKSTFPAYWDAETNYNQIRDLGGFDLDSSAKSINDLGHVVGHAQISTNQTRAILWSGGRRFDLGTLSGNGSSYANDINNQQQIVGRSNFGSSVYSRAVLWEGIGNIKTNLGTLGGAQSEANAINELGQIVGSSYVSGGSAFNAALWMKVDGQYEAFNLNDLLDDEVSQDGWLLQRAYAINDNGWIVGNARNSISNQTHAFLLTPNVSSIPEPQSYTLFILGFIIIFRFRKLLN